MKTLKRACTPRASTFDPTRRDTVLDLSDLIDHRIDPADFFAENHFTEGMKTLLTEGFRRLEGKSTQGVFKLTQAMGGGKTHNLLAFGLLAAHPDFRARVMGDFHIPGDLGPVRVVAFSGRESDAPLGVWGAIAEQLGKKEQFKDYYTPLSAPGQTAWVNLLQGEPLVIMLDELPPYFVNAASKSIGNSDLSVVTATAYLRDQAIKELKDRLKQILDSADQWCYLRLRPLPAVDEIEVESDKVTLVVSEPHPNAFHPDLVTLYEQHTYRNRLCFLTGQRAFDSLIGRARELKAITQIIAEMHQEGVADSDPQTQQARDQLLPRFLARFHSAIRETFTTLYHPTRDRLARTDFLMEFKENRYGGEEQVRTALAGKQKYTEDISSDTFRRKVEARLFTLKSMLWTEIERRAATNSAWQWHRADALARLKADCLHKDIWREEGSYVDKGPFPKPRDGRTHPGAGARRQFGSGRAAALAGQRRSALRGDRRPRDPGLRGARGPGVQDGGRY